jgi:hypothetical protein
VLYEMLAGEPPYPAPDSQRAIAGHLKDPVPAVRRLRPEVPVALEAAVRRALAKRREDRFETARGFGDALGIGGAKRSLGSRAAAAALLALAALGAAYLLPGGCYVSS